MINEGPQSSEKGILPVKATTALNMLARTGADGDEEKVVEIRTIRRTCNHNDRKTDNTDLSSALHR